MKKDLINKEELLQKSAIFSEPLPEETTDVPESDGEESTAEQEKCKVITLAFDTKRRGIFTHKIYPDSKVTVLYNSHLSAYFVGLIEKERLFDVALYYIKEVVVATDCVIFEATDLFNNKFYVYVGEQGMFYTSPDFFKVDNSTNEVQVLKRPGIDGIVTSSLISPKVKEFSSDKITSLMYEDISYSIDYEHNTVFYVEAGTNKRVLLALSSFSMLGYYLNINENGRLVVLEGEDYSFIARPTTALIVLLNNKDSKYYLLSCTNQLVVPLDTVFDGSYEDLDYMNGLALLIKQNESGYTFNVFTPNHQGIVLSPSFELDGKSVRNGIYFIKDNVLLLENGSLLFTSTTKKSRVVVRGKEFKLPTKYLGND